MFFHEKCWYQNISLKHHSPKMAPTSRNNSYIITGESSVVFQDFFVWIVSRNWMISVIKFSRSIFDTLMWSIDTFPKTSGWNLNMNQRREESFLEFVILQVATCSSYLLLLLLVCAVGCFFPTFSCLFCRGVAGELQLSRQELGPGESATLARSLELDREGVGGGFDLTKRWESVRSVDFWLSRHKEKGLTSRSTVCITWDL